MSARSVQIMGKDDRTVAEVDASTNALVVTHAGGISNVIQQGISFLVTRVVKNRPADATIVIFADVGSLDINLKITASVEKNATLDMYESPTLSNLGTTIEEVNRNRTSDIVSGVNWRHTPTITSNGTVLANWFVLSQERIPQAWVLDNSKMYLFILTNISGSQNDMALEMDYYEPGAVAP